MPKKQVYIPIDEVNSASSEYAVELKTNPEFSLEVDPINKYNFTSREKKFISLWVEHKNLPVVAQMMDIDEDQALAYYDDARVKGEIKRLNRAIYHNQFATKLAGIDELGGYLTSLLIGDCTEEDRPVEIKDKLQVVKLLMEVNKLKQTALDKGPQVIETVAINEELKDLGVKDIKSLLAKSEAKASGKEYKDENTIKEEIIDSIEIENKTFFQAEERAVLMQQSIDQLKEVKAKYAKINFGEDNEQQSSES